MQQGRKKLLGGGAIGATTTGVAFTGTVFNGALQLLLCSFMRYVSQIPPWQGFRSSKSISSDIGCGYVTFTDAPVTGSVAPAPALRASACRSVFSILSLHEAGGSYIPGKKEMDTKNSFSSKNFKNLVHFLSVRTCEMNCDIRSVVKFLVTCLVSEILKDEYEIALAVRHLVL